MFSFRSSHGAVLLLVLAQSLVFASFENENTWSEASAEETMISFLETPWIERIGSLSRVSEPSCADEVEALSQAILSQQTWALSMLDASGKLQSGILKGNVRNLGMYDECIEAAGQYNDTNVQGKYCTVAFGSLSTAVCVPSSCNETDVVEIVNAVVENVTGIGGWDLEITGVSCIAVGSEDFTVGEILTILFFSVVGAFMIFCTICEFVKKCKPAGVSPVVNELAKFSLYTSALATLSTKMSPRMMPAIQGMRFISTCWVVLGHRYLYMLYSPTVNTLDLLEWNNSWTAVYIQAAPFAVDTFFVISGFLMSYLYLKSKQSGKRSNFPMMYFHRYLRLTPCLAVLTLFVAVLLHRVSNGPLWSSLISQYPARCQKNWWVNLLYLQNLLKVDDMCLLHSWYLAVDMQLFWISPFILYPLYRWPKCGLGILGLLLVASVVTPTAILVSNKYLNAVLRIDGQTDDLTFNFLNFYIPTYNRGCAYFVGVFLGYDAAKGKRNLSQMNVAINWVVACILMLVCFLSTKRMFDTSYDYDVVLEGAFALLLRPFWSIAIAWIVYATAYGYGGIVTRLLSLPIFLPLSRLSYCIYLVHIVIEASKVLSSQTSTRFADFLIINEFWADLVLSIAVGFIFSLFFESPVIVLEKMLTNRGRKRSPVREPKKHVEVGTNNNGMIVED